jgi:hypothetical protein
MVESRPSTVRLEALARAERSRFKADLQEAFTTAAREQLGHTLPLIPSDEDIERSLNAAGAVAYEILAADVVVGGAIVRIDAGNGRNSLDFFFIKTSQHGKGFGQEAWRAIERQYPEARIWETHTPYFETRNIHFYVNRCGFKIVEYYIDEQPNHDAENDANSFEAEGMFRMEKSI